MCLSPVYALKLYSNEFGKNYIKILPIRADYNLAYLKDRFGSDNVLCLPCGKCDECRKDYATDWAIRCVCESQYHKYTYFITLTYNEYSIGYACKGDLKAFIKHFRNRDKNVKFFARGEHGELNGRFHWHIVLFTDYELEPKYPMKIGAYYYYSSDFISKYWVFGFHNFNVAENGDCAAYVANYSCKKVNPDLNLSEAELKMDKCYMSRNLGKVYFVEHLQDIIDDQYKLYGRFNRKFVVNVPGCFIRWFKEIDELGLDDLKKEKEALGKVNAANGMRELGTIHQEEFFKNKHDYKEKHRKIRRL